MSSDSCVKSESLLAVGRERQADRFGGFGTRADDDFVTAGGVLAVGEPVGGNAEDLGHALKIDDARNGLVGAPLGNGRLGDVDAAGELAHGDAGTLEFGANAAAECVGRGGIHDSPLVNV